MISPTTKPIYVLTFLFALFLQFSCSKDSDLLADYVVLDSQSALVEIKVITSINEPVVIAPIENGVNAVITEVAVPTMGTASLNGDNTITYTPNTGAIGTDVFGYSSNEGSGSIAVTTLSNKIEFWKGSFNMEWARASSYYAQESAGSEPTKTQRRYFDHNPIDGLIAILQATGDLDYVDDIIWYTDRVMSLATKSTDGYYDWPVGGVDYQLYDAHGWRNIFKFLWLAKKYPAIKSKLTTERYDSYLSWWTTNLWDKWVSRGNGSVMRSLTHMSSHMASNMALYLSLIETEQTKKNNYLSWVAAWNNDESLKATYTESNRTGFRGVLRTEFGGYVWKASWGSTSGYTDITHSNAEIQSVVNQYLLRVGNWTSNDMDKFIVTINKMMSASPTPSNYSEMPFRLDAVYNSADNNRPFIHYGWCMLGRFDKTLQKRLESVDNKQLKAGYSYIAFLGNMAYNQAYLDNTLVYPEF